MKKLPNAEPGRTIQPAKFYVSHSSFIIFTEVCT